MPFHVTMLVTPRFRVSGSWEDTAGYGNYHHLFVTTHHRCVKRVHPGSSLAKIRILSITPDMELNMFSSGGVFL